MKEYRVRPFKGVWIDADIWLSKDLSIIEKVLLAEIDSFCNKTHSCYASNKYFAEFLGVSGSRISHLITDLLEKGYIAREIVYAEDGKTIKKRLLSTTKIYNRKTQEGIAKNSDSPIAKNSKENNTYIINNNILSSDLDLARTTREIIVYLNEKTKKNYKATTSKTKTLVKTRLNEGFTLDDFKKVIDIKTSQWLGNAEMERYLRPETLFGTHFDGYLNEKEVKKKEEKVERPVYIDEMPEYYN